MFRRLAGRFLLLVYAWSLPVVADERFSDRPIYGLSVSWGLQRPDESRPTFAMFVMDRKDFDLVERLRVPLNGLRHPDRSNLSCAPDGCSPAILGIFALGTWALVELHDELQEE